MKNIQKVYQEVEYTTYSFINENGEYEEMTICNDKIIKLIDTLGKSLMKKSFIKSIKNSKK